MPELNCPNCGEEYEVDIKVAPAERDIGIMGPYIDDYDAPDDCESCGHDLQEYTKNMEEEKHGEWIETWIDGQYYRD